MEKASKSSTRGFEFVAIVAIPTLLYFPYQVSFFFVDFPHGYMGIGIRSYMTDIKSSLGKMNFLFERSSNCPPLNS